MDETKRLQLIVEAVKYCKHARMAGMPSAGYTKALREAVHILLERRIGAPADKISGPKICAAKFRSEKAKGLRFGNRELIYDHAVPFNLLQDRLLALKQVSPRSVKRILNKFCVSALITQEEHERLSRARLRDRMPEKWDGHDPLARYKAVRIKMVRNELYSNCHGGRQGGHAPSLGKRSNTL